MSFRKVTILSFHLFLFNFNAFAEYKPDPLEPAPDRIECSWSKLKEQELRLCQERKRYFDKMTPEEKKKYNEEVEKRRTDARLKRIERVIPGIPQSQ